MQTPKEALLALMRGEKYDIIPEYYSVAKSLVFPGERWIDLQNFDPYGTGPDAWGVLWTNRGPNPMVAKDFRLFDSMEDWEDHVHFPPLPSMSIPTRSMHSSTRCVSTSSSAFRWPMMRSIPT